MLKSVRVVVLDTEWGEEWPLWFDDPEEPLIEPRDLGLSADLVSQLGRFYNFWYQHDQPDSGWDLPGNQQAAIKEAARLTELLTAELQGRFEVRNDFKRTRGPNPRDSDMRLAE